MEGLLDYLLYALFGHNVTEVHKNASCSNMLRITSWTIVFEGYVYITLDETDLDVIRYLYEERKERLDDTERERYLKIFKACV